MTEQPLAALELSATAEVVSELLEHLKEGRSAHVTGLPGSGRSHLLRRVQGELSLAGMRSIEVRGNRAFVDRPLAALALAGVVVDGGSPPASGNLSLTRAADALEKLVGRGQTVLVVDDAAQLDRLSAGVIAAVRARKSFPMLFSSRPVTNPVGSLDALVATAQPGIEVGLGPLRLEQIHQLVHDLLPGVVEPEAIAQIATLSGGLPGLLSAIVDVASRSGRLVIEDGVWRARGELWSDRLGLALRPFLADVGRDEVSALSVLARAGTVTSEQAGELVSASMVGQFSRLGLLRSDQGFQRVGVYVYPPALAEMLRRASAPAADPQISRPPVRLKSGWRTRALAGADAAAYADRVLEYWRSEVVSRGEAWRANPSPANAVPLLAAMRSAGADGEDIEAVCRGTREDLSDPTEYAEFCVWSAVYRAVVQRDFDGAVASLRAKRQQHPNIDAFLRAYEAHLILITEQVPGRRLLGPVSPVDEPSGAEALVGVRVEALLARGQTTEAAELLAGYSPVRPRAASVGRVYGGLAKVLGDDVPGGVEWALEGFSDAMEAMDSGTIAAHAYVAALGMTMLGTFDELNSIVEVAFRLAGTDSLQDHYRAGLFSMASIVAGWEGRTEYARSLAAQAASFGSGNGPFPGMLESLPLLAEPEVDAGRIWDLVDELLAREYFAGAVFLAARAVEDDPDARRAELVVRLGGASQSRVLRTLCGYVSAVASRDVAGLVQVIDELRRHCGPLYAMRAGITRALLLREDEDLDGWLAQADSAWDEGGGLGGRVGGIFGRIARVVNLTQREEEVVAMAARGRSALEIAAAMDVTRRTAESHIQTAYRKIGVRNRHELRQATSTWLTL